MRCGEQHPRCGRSITGGQNRCFHGPFTRSWVTSLSCSYKDAPGLGVGGHSIEVPGSDWTRILGAAGQNGVLSGNEVKEKGMGCGIPSPWPWPWVVSLPLLSSTAGGAGAAGLT